MNRRLIAVLALLTVPALASAGPYRYYSTGYCQPSYYPSYSYSYPTYQYQASTYTAPAYVAPPAPTSENFEAEMLKYITTQKRMEVVNKLLETVPGYATAHASYYSGQGATLYGVAPYSVKAAVIQENVGVNLELADQRSARLLDGTKEALSQGMSQRQEFLAQSGADSARTREINAKGNAAALVLQNAAALLQSAEAAPSNKTTTVYSGTGSAPVQVTQPATAQNPQAAEFMKMARQDCGRCHSPGPTMKGNFNIENVLSLNRSQSAQVWAKLTSDDPAKVMPKPEAGKPIQHLPPDHMMAWAAALSQAQ